MKLLVFLPIPVFMAIVTYLVDPAGLFHDESKEIAQSMLAGNNTLFWNGNVNERNVKQQLIVNMPEHVECIAVGPSLVMGVSQTDAGTDSFYNLGESGADFYDILAQFGLLELNKKQYDRVIFCVDSYFFDETLNKTFTRNKELKPYAQYMLRLLDGQEGSMPSNDNSPISNYKLLISPSSFQSALTLAKKNGLGTYLSNNKRWMVVDNSFYEYSYYRPDGSWVYSSEIQNYDEQNVIQDAKAYNIEKQFSKGRHLGSYPQETFEKLIRYLQARNVRVDLYLCPLAPALWDRIDQRNYYVLNELEDFAHEVSQKYHLKLTGSYNPYKLGIHDKDFYDSRHVRHELLSTYFDFKP